FELFNPSRRSSSAICAFRAAISAACAAISAMSSSRDGSAGESAFIESLNRSPIPMSSKTYKLDFAKTPTQPGQGPKLNGGLLPVVILRPADAWIADNARPGCGTLRHARVHVHLFAP